eukprot:m.28770 g.28770  ORF g.28770 m.28770 type:complete len:309 (+) comp8034_c0_seq1:273-1199(+)
MASEDMEFKGKVAIVTGAGNGLGKAYAMELARRGASVVVNDVGGALNGEKDGDGMRVSDAVVAEIKAMGGSAVANYDSVVDGKNIVDTAIKAFGTVHIIINNAGIIRDKKFKNMSAKDWDLVMLVHVAGAKAVTQAAWPYMMKQEYGRIVNITSIAGLYGNVGQANYSAAKMAMVGFSQTLAKEGRSNNVYVNVVAPIAYTRMLSTIQNPVMKMLKIEHVVPMVVYLCHESVDETGCIFESGGGVFQLVRLTRAQGYSVDPTKPPPSIEDIRDNFEKIMEMEDSTTVDMDEGPTSAAIMNVMRHSSKL